MIINTEGYIMISLASQLAINIRNNNGKCKYDNLKTALMMVIERWFWFVFPFKYS